MKDVGWFDWHSVYFYRHDFSRFGMLYQEKSGNPDFRDWGWTKEWTFPLRYKVHGGQVHPWWPSSPLGANFTPSGKLILIKTGLWATWQLNCNKTFHLIYTSVFRIAPCRAASRDTVRISSDLFAQCRATRSDTKQGCQIFLGTTYKNGKNIPNDHKIYQIVTKYTKWP
jgi:hypothetical protein